MSPGPGKDCQAQVRKYAIYNGESEIKSPEVIIQDNDTTIILTVSIMIFTKGLTCAHDLRQCMAKKCGILGTFSLSRNINYWMRLSK